MKRLPVLGVTALAILVLAAEASAQRGGGAVRGGMRGAVVGGMVGGSEGAATGAKVGVVTGATRAAIGRETQARTQYATTTEYQNAQHSNFNEAPPEVLGTTAAGTAKKASGEAVIRKDGKPIVGITFPSDWNQKTGDNYISAVSGDGQAYSMLVTLDGVADKQAGIKKVKEGLEKYLNGRQVRRAQRDEGRCRGHYRHGKGQEGRRRRRLRGWALRCRERTTRRGGIRRRFQNRGSLQGDGPRHLFRSCPRPSGDAGRPRTTRTVSRSRRTVM